MATHDSPSLETLTLAHVLYGYANSDNALELEAFLDRWLWENDSAILRDRLKEAARERARDLAAITPTA